jgi:hypothetical protein
VQVRGRSWRSAVNVVWLLAVGKVRGVAVGVSSAVVVAVGGLLAIVFFAFMVAGGIYRSECVYDNGTHTVS